MNTVKNVLFASCIAFLLAALVGLPVMILWDSCLIYAIPACKEITWMQAIGLVILVHILFKSEFKIKTGEE